MIVRSTLQIPLAEPKTAAAILTAMDILEKHSSNAADATIAIYASSLKDPSLLLAFAELLPPDVLAFETESGGGKLTAAEFILSARAPAKFNMWRFDGDLRTHLSLKETLDVLRALSARKPSELANSQFWICISSIVWKGAPAESEGELYVDTAGLVATLACRAASKKDKTLAPVFATVAKQIPLNFANGKIDAYRETRARPFISLQQNLIAQICYRAAIDCAAQELKNSGVEFGPAFGLVDQLNALGQRIERRLAGEKVRVNFPSIMKKFFRERFPMLKFDDEGPSESLHVRKSLSASLQLWIAVERIHFCGLGKAFRLLFGAEITSGKLAGLQLQSRRGELDELTGKMMQCWVYGTEAELGVATDQLHSVLAHMLPALERSFLRYLDPIPDEIPHEIERRAALSAREAVEISRPIAAKWSDEPALVSVVGGGNLRDPRLPWVGRDGRLTDGGVWIATFASKPSRTTLHVHVPRIGAIRTSEFITMSEEIPIDEAWMDSDKAIALAHEAALQRGYDLTGWGVELHLSHLDQRIGEAHHDFRWLIEFFAPTQRGSQRLWVQFHPETGGDLQLS